MSKAQLEADARCDGETDTAQILPSWVDRNFRARKGTHAAFHQLSVSFPK
jgi:hypothetical protein